MINHDLAALVILNSVNTYTKFFHLSRELALAPVALKLLKNRLIQATCRATLTRKALEPLALLLLNQFPLMFFDLVQHRLVQRRTACAASKHSTANGGMTGRLHVSIICVYLRLTLL